MLTVTHDLYSTDGQLLAELDRSGNTLREYLYLQSWPVAVVDYPTPVAPVTADELPEALADTLEEFPEAAESAPVDSPASAEKPVPTTRPPVSVDSRAVTTTPVMTYLHPDHLGTPRLATDSSKRVVWRWDSAPFGDTPPAADPDGDGVPFTLNLRFPGQYFDAETGLHYNYYRDYDPATGRYLESDPIGLRGGVGTYGYVEGNPLAKSDPFGLEPGLLKVCCDVIGGPGFGGYLGYWFGASHCYVQTPSGTVYEYDMDRGAGIYREPPKSRPKDCFLCIPKRCTDPEICAEDFSHRYGTKPYRPSQTSNTFISRLLAHCCDRLVGDVDYATRGSQGFGH